MDDRKLLQELNLTAQQPCRAPITLYISFNNGQFGQATHMFVCASSKACINTLDLECPGVMGGETDLSVSQGERVKKR